MTKRPDQSGGKALRSDKNRTRSTLYLSADEINKFVDDWRHAQALQVAPYSGQPTGQSVTLNFTGALPALQFEVLAGQDELILGRKDAGVQYHFTSETGQRMFTPKASRPNSATPQDRPAAN